MPSQFHDISDMINTFFFLPRIIKRGDHTEKLWTTFFKYIYIYIWILIFPISKENVSKNRNWICQLVWTHCVSCTIMRSTSFFFFFLFFAKLWGALKFFWLLYIVIYIFYISLNIFIMGACGVRFFMIVW